MSAPETVCLDMSTALDGMVRVDLKRQRLTTEKDRPPKDQPWKALEANKTENTEAWGEGGVSLAP